MFFLPAIPLPPRTCGLESVDFRRLARLGGQLLEDLAEGHCGTLGVGLLADAGNAIDLKRIGHFGQGFCAAGRDRHQQQLVAAAQQLHLLAGPEWGAAEDVKDLLGQYQRPRGAVLRMAQATTKKSPSTIARLPPTVIMALSGEPLAAAFLS